LLYSPTHELSSANIQHSLRQPQHGKLWSLTGHAGGSGKLLVFLNGPPAYNLSAYGIILPVGATATP